VCIIQWSCALEIDSLNDFKVLLNSASVYYPFTIWIPVSFFMMPSTLQSSWIENRIYMHDWIGNCDDWTRLKKKRKYFIVLVLQLVQFYWYWYRVTTEILVLWQPYLENLYSHKNNQIANSCHILGNTWLNGKIWQLFCTVNMKRHSHLKNVAVHLNNCMKEAV